MPIDTAKQREEMAVYYGTRATHAAAHTADPGTTGANEIAGTRKVINWVPGTEDGTVTATVVLDIPAGQVVRGIGLFNGASGTDYRDGGGVTEQSYSVNGTYTINLTFQQQ